MTFRDVVGVLTLVLVGATASLALASDADTSRICRQAGLWVGPGEGAVVPLDRVIAAAVASDIVLLGETHGDADTHRWQLHTLAALRGQRPKMVVGFEMFPRAVQPALDRWVAGTLDADAFLEEAQWARSWGLATEHYLPLFHFARLHRVPMQALNVDRMLISEVSRVGGKAVILANREGVGYPAPASEAYRTWLHKVWDHEAALAAHGNDTATSDDPTMSGERFDRFVDAQQTWDRAMAEGLMAARERRPDALAVGVMGRGHVEHRYGVAAQLADLGETRVTTMLPVFAGEDCEEAAESHSADWLFVVRQSITDETPPPRLGVIIEDDVAGVRILEVMAHSVAQAAMLAEGDIVVMAAGVPVTRTADLIDIVRRQAPGTWLPLDVLRAARKLEIVAKFPAQDPAQDPASPQ